MKKQLGDICQISIKPFAGNAVGYAIYPSEGEDEEGAIYIHSNLER